MHEEESQITPASEVPTEAPRVDTETREAALAAAISSNLRSGWKVESQTQFSVALIKGKNPNHILHLLLTILTLGLWGIIWIILAVTNKPDHRFLSVDASGRVSG